MSKLQKQNSRSVIYTRWFSNKQQVSLISIFVLGMADTMSALFGLYTDKLNPNLLCPPYLIMPYCPILKLWNAVLSAYLVSKREAIYSLWEQGLFYRKALLIDTKCSK